MTKHELETLLNEAEALIEHGNYAFAEANARRVLGFIGHKQTGLTAHAKNIIADCAWRASRLQEALEFASSALLDAREANDLLQRGYGFANLGTIHRELSLYGESLENYHAALDMFRLLDRPLDSARIMMNIGNVLRQLMQFEEAEEYLKQAQELFIKADRTIDLARVLNVRGLICDELSQVHDALNFYRQSLEMFESVGDDPGNYISMAWLFKNIANAYRHLSLYDESLSFYKSSYEYFEHSGNLLGAAAVKGGIGDLYSAAKWAGHDEQKAVSYLTEALEELEELGDKHVRYKCHRSLAELYERKQQWKEFATHFKQFYELEQEVQNDAARKKAAADAYERRIAEIRKEQEIAARYTDTIRRQLEIIQRDLRTAEKIQQSILPNIAVVTAHIKDKWDVAAKMVAARNVGGDFYDVFRIDDHRIGILVADVSGKGMPAALFMVISRTMLKMQALTSPDPGDALRKANVMLCNENVLSMFVTIFYAVLDTRTGLMQFANAGHNPPFVLRADGTTECINYGNSMIMAVYETAEFPTHEIQLNHGDCLICYTDGVTEAMNEEQQLYSEERLERWLRNVAGKYTLPERINALITELSDYSGDSGQTDDITIMLLHRLQPAG
jgi:sigma-B regulation protein RsbU (phosphoserine phosphatase)